ncbi:MAG: hypothetical protein KDB35_16640 [Acidimicrobiales bacterium]|nr:hypothetical protein [Acidimicrobiales bacterium]MCB1016584.1 hypothetical protein [Acidimicrobiales bacterium]MCB9374215.1 hypothetical protein [Microthrixaceae bacterium]
MDRLRTHRWAIATVMVAAAMVTPVVLDRDSFPLSTYPMYARARPAEVTLPAAVAVDGEGDVHRLSLELVGGNDDPLIVAAELRDAIAGGRADRTCAAVASRVEAAGDTVDGHRPVAIEVVTERYDTVDRVLDEADPVARRVHARCPIGDGR